MAPVVATASAPDPEQLAALIRQQPAQLQSLLFLLLSAIGSQST